MRPNITGKKREKQRLIHGIGEASPQREVFQYHIGARYRKSQLQGQRGEPDLAICDSLASVLGDIDNRVIARGPRQAGTDRVIHGYPGQVR